MDSGRRGADERDSIVPIKANKSDNALNLRSASRFRLRFRGSGRTDRAVI